MSIIGLDQLHATLTAHRTHITGLDLDARWLIGPGTVGLLHLQAHNPEQDEAEEELEVDYQGEEITIGFNVGYLLDVLGVLDTDTVNMALIDSNSSTLVTPSGSSECRYVIMPMRL